ncbi:MAG: zinc metalloprotease HtpX [Gammaproteobacteria bacterium]|nr:zinc metalloprotease HtpX [Gammaproteobacteria bacterium]
MRGRDINAELWQQHAWRNRLQSFVLLVSMGGFLALLGWLLWGGDGIAALLTMGVIGVLFNPSISPQLVMRLYGASPVGANQAPALWTVLSRLAERAELPERPELYYVPSRMLNAFAVGAPRHSAIAVTDGLLRQLNLRELTGVLAHEISHIRSNDLWVMGLADMFRRTTSLLSLVGQFLLVVNLPLVILSAVSINWFAIGLLVFAPNLSALAQLALSRTREYDADLNAVRLTGDPEGLSAALAKIKRAQGGWWERIFFPGRRIPEPSLLRTHPVTGERIARLMALKPDVAGADVLPVGAAVDLGPFAGRPVVRPPRRHFSGLWY